MKTSLIKFLSIIIFLISILNITSIHSQNYDKKIRYAVGTFHTNNTTINGISFGAYFRESETKKYVKTNGIRLEANAQSIAASILTPFFPTEFIYKNKKLKGKFTKNHYKYDEIINGINISTGTFGDIKYNGFTIGLVQSGVLLNGFAIAGLQNQMNKVNGIQLAGYSNFSFYTSGLQISLFNGSNNMNGVQIGFMNFAKNIKGSQISNFNSTDYLNGLQIGGYNHVNKKMNGLQIGIFNRSAYTKGIQIGLWNINEKRKLPIINWNF